MTSARRDWEAAYNNSPDDSVIIDVTNSPYIEKELREFYDS